MKKTIVVLLTLALTVTLSGCGEAEVQQPQPSSSIAQNKQTDPQSEATVSPESLLTKAEVSKIMESGVVELSSSEQPAVNLRLSLYTTEDDSFFQVGIVQKAGFEKDGGGDSVDPKQIYLDVKEGFPDAEELQGFGDDAFLAPPGLHILKGDYYLTLAAGNTSDPETIPRLKEAAAIAVTRLP